MMQQTAVAALQRKLKSQFSLKPHSNRHKVMRVMARSMRESDVTGYQWRLIQTRRGKSLQARLWPGSEKQIYRQLKREYRNVSGPWLAG